MTADERALLAAVVADPDNDLPRLVYADWLDDQGDPERAEYVRAAVSLSRSTWGNPIADQSLHLLGRTIGLYPVMQSWSDELTSFIPADAKTSVYFVRGAPVGIKCDAVYLIENARLLCEILPLSCLQIQLASWRQVQQIATYPMWKFINSLSLNADETDNHCLAATLSKLPTQLAEFTLTSTTGYGEQNRLPDGWLDRSADLVRYLAFSPVARQLRRINLSCAGVGSLGIDALTKSPYLGNLRILILTGNHLNEEAQRQLKSRYGQRVIFKYGGVNGGFTHADLFG